VHFFFCRKPTVTPAELDTQLAAQRRQPLVSSKQKEQNDNGSISFASLVACRRLSKRSVWHAAKLSGRP
jgi:hypothetical protein